MQKLSPLLVIDADLEFIASLKNDPAKEFCELISVKNEKELSELLSGPFCPYAGIFLNPAVTQPEGLSILRIAREYRPVLPIYLLYEQNHIPSLSIEKMQELGIHQAVKKPLTYSQMVELLSPMAITCNSREFIEQAERSQSVIEVAQENGFVAVRAEDFLLSSACFFDVYVHLTRNKYLKLLHAGDTFSEDRLEGYIKKGVAYFYIKKDVHEKYLQHCDELVTNLLKEKEAPVEIKVSQVLNYGEQTITFLKNNSVNEQNLKHAYHFVEDVKSLIKQMNIENNKFMSKLLSHTATYEHSVATTLLTGVLSHSLSFTAEPTRIVGLASFLHDIGLFQMPDFLWSEDESQMTEDQKRNFQVHPILGAKILRTMRTVDAAAIKAVEEHHVRKDGKGFPERHSFNIVAEIVGICDDFERLIKKTIKNPQFQLLKELERDVFPNFSRQIVYEFRSAFFPVEP